jgi:phenylalanyl-tRNA synthetase alpha chain
MGPALNGLKARVTEALRARARTSAEAALKRGWRGERSTSPCRCAQHPRRPAAFIPVSQVIDELTAIFADMGFSIAEGPDIETDESELHGAELPGRPSGARDARHVLLQSQGRRRAPAAAHPHLAGADPHHASQEPPIRVIIPGRTYRCDSDQTHTPMFHQVEGLVIDKESHIGHLKWILENSARRSSRSTTSRCASARRFFPFTEPSMEVDIQCDRSGGEVKIGEGDDWLEILGCGMVHPNVIRNCGLDPDEYQGFAWGMGIDRIAMLKYGMPDLRAFFDADVRWIQHYGFRPLDLPTLFGGLSS